MEKMLNDLKNDITKLQRFHKTNSLQAIILGALVFFSFGFTIFVSENGKDGLYFFIFMITISLVLIAGGALIMYNEHKKFKIINQILIDAEGILGGKQDIEEILGFTKDIYNAISTKSIIDYQHDIMYLQQISSKHNPDTTLKTYTIKATGVISELLMQVCLILLLDLKNDLSKNISDYKNRIILAQSENEAHIGKIKEWTQFSELQSARLDRQIEQFEELQRMIVKV